MSSQARLEFHPSANADTLRRMSKAKLMLRRLQQGSCKTYELMQIGGAGFSSRLRELRNEGHVIKVEMYETHAVYTLAIE